MFDRSLLKIFDDGVLYAPPEKVQLGARRREPLELDALRTAKRVEQFLAVAIQTRLVGDVNREHLPGRCGVRHVVSLGVVRHEPLEFAEGYTLTVSQNIVKLLTILWCIEKFREARQKKIRLAH
jgi:predicted component of type VI protein secretion system